MASVGEPPNRASVEASPMHPTEQASARQPLPWGRSLGPSRTVESVWVSCYHQQGKEGQVVTAADSPCGSELRGAALGRPISCRSWRGGEGTVREGRESMERRPERGRGRSPTGGALPPKGAPSSLPLLAREGPPGPTFSHIPEHTAESHVLKPEWESG